MIASATSTRVGDDINQPALAARNEGVVLMTGRLLGTSCSTPFLTIATRQPDGNLKFFREINVAVASDTGVDLAQATMPAGAYHITRLVCSVEKLSFGRFKNGLIEPYALESIATFDVKPGEIANIGQLNVKPVGLTLDKFTFEALPVPGPVLAAVAKAKPRLMAQVADKPMKLATPPPVVAIQRFH